jgi:C1A family cysteine protease
MMLTDLIFYGAIISLIVSFVFIGLNIKKLSTSALASVDGVTGTLTLSKAFRWKLHDHLVMAKETAHQPSSVITTQSLNSTVDLATSSSASIAGNDLWKNDNSTFFDQGAWGSCTAFAMKYALAIYAKQNPTYPVDDISAAFLYAESRIVLALPLTKDTGSTNSATVRVVSTLGVKNSAEYPYYAKNIFLNPTITLGANLGSPSNKVNFINFRFVSNLEQNILNLKATLNTKPIIVAILLYASSLTDSVMVTGNIPMPSKADLNNGPVGGHAICITGYDASNFIFRNSWGQDVGNAGTFTLPHAYLATFARGRMSYVSDAWYYL